MVHLNLQDSYNAVSASLVAWRIFKAAPRVIAKFLVPILRFIATTTGSYEIKEYLYDHYPPRRKHGHSSTD